MEQVFAKSAHFDSLLQVNIGRTDNSQARQSLLTGADSRKRAVLQKTKQFTLQIQIHVADLIQEQRPALRDLNQTRPILARARKGAPFGAK